ncbi:protein NUCLEAR FUSION DEFECTIVE 4 isoform X1 [Cryptomeria japonica]|uniref:protein NUCLEAR FUSION DEFECTIVE 4 isoform X1 n=1 Tax=Cryptomeria japonica TaxID=3369 RepID=UPI0027DAB446|nr:protein NUCLEAR FUSION DEFECTIVE 4 isoform X1 [Cryptomeria japonica]XP_057818066.2 protein NUCLEAR FUSION DEFECTIVE 4 isoform X1 [Cryptomeria japonica]XP_057818068.2 protein NUCLEAR FUSION DEFECTIVE 4 isoform X1 [Cryptomeria japonica]
MRTQQEKHGNFPNHTRSKRNFLWYDRWFSLSAAMILMGCSGLTYTYAVYSEHIKEKFHYSQEQIDNIGAAKDFGAFIGIVSGFFYNIYPPWVTVYVGALLHFFGYGLTWMTMSGDTPTSIWMLFLYMALGNGGDAWVDTACMMSSLQNFEDHRGTAMGILKSQLGLSGAMFVTVYEAFLRPDVNNFIFMLTLVPTILFLLLGFFISPVAPTERDKDIGETMLRFKIIYGMIVLLGIYLALSMLIQVRFQLGNPGSHLFAIVMFVIASGMYAVPVARKQYVPTPRMSQVDEIDLLPIPLVHVNHKKHLDEKSESFAGDIEMERIPLKGVPAFIEVESVETSVLGNTKEHIEVQKVVDLNVWESLVAIDFWLVTFVVVSGGGSGLAIINNFAQIGNAARSKEVGVFVQIISLGSCFGRITSGYLSDLLMTSGYPRPLCLFITQLTMTISCILLAFGGVFYLYIGSALIGMAYGAYWTLSPAILSELFGIKPFAMLYKIIGITPTIGSYILSAKVLGVLYDKQAALYHSNSANMSAHGEENTCYGWQCFGFALLYLSIICFIGCLACLWLIKRTRRLYNRKYQVLCYSTNSKHQEFNKVLSNTT